MVVVVVVAGGIKSALTREQFWCQWESRLKHSFCQIFFTPQTFTIAPLCLISPLLKAHIISWRVNTFFLRLHVAQSYQVIKGSLQLPKQMNFQKSSKRSLIPLPHFRRIMLQIFGDTSASFGTILI